MRLSFWQNSLKINYGIALKPLLCNIILLAFKLRVVAELNAPRALKTTRRNAAGLVWATR